MYGVSLLVWKLHGDIVWVAYLFIFMMSSDEEVAASPVSLLPSCTTSGLSRTMAKTHDDTLAMI